MNDHPTLEVWPDGYYLSANQLKCGFLCQYFGPTPFGQGVAVLERDAMLNGDPARMVYFNLFPVNPDLKGMLPADLDGAPPPAGTPNYFFEWDDSSWIGPSGAIRPFRARETHSRSTGNLGGSVTRSDGVP